MSTSEPENVKVTTKCPYCKGTGVVPKGLTLDKCPMCAGKGYIEVYKLLLFTRFRAI